MAGKTLDEWLEHATRLHDQVINMGLDRVARVSERLLASHMSKISKHQKSKDHPRITTVAGTNGKGSTVATLESLALAAGLKVGAYTSPHLLEFNERIRIMGEDLTDERIVQAFEQVETQREGEALTYFEYTTLVAFAAFKEAGLDLWILEVGLGGRLDAVNIVDPDIAIITTIDIDHQDWLGNNREVIGREKAGIMRPGCPLLLGDTDMPLSVFDYADKLGCPIYQWQRDFNLEQSEGTSAGLNVTSEPSGTLTWSGKDAHEHPLAIELTQLPDIPYSNLATAVQAAVLLGIPVEMVLAGKGFPTLHLQGRCQRMGQSPEVVLDVAHNPHAARYLENWLNIHPVADAQVAIFSALKDKDVDGVVDAMESKFRQWFIFQLEDERAFDIGQLEQHLISKGQQVEICANAADAMRNARQAVGTEGRVVVFGSFLTVAAILQTGMISH